MFCPSRSQPKTEGQGERKTQCIIYWTMGKKVVENGKSGQNLRNWLFYLRKRYALTWLFAVTLHPQKRDNDSDTNLYYINQGMGLNVEVHPFSFVILLSR